MSDDMHCEDLKHGVHGGVIYERLNHTSNGFIYMYECAQFYSPRGDTTPEGTVQCYEIGNQMRFADLKGGELPQPKCYFNTGIGVAYSVAALLLVVAVVALALLIRAKRRRQPNSQRSKRMSKPITVLSREDMDERYPQLPLHPAPSSSSLDSVPTRPPVFPRPNLNTLAPVPAPRRSSVSTSQIPQSQKNDQVDYLYPVQTLGKPHQIRRSSGLGESPFESDIGSGNLHTPFGKSTDNIISHHIAPPMMNPFDPETGRFCDELVDTDPIHNVAFDGSGYAVPNVHINPAFTDDDEQDRYSSFATLDNLESLVYRDLREDWVKQNPKLAQEDQLRVPVRSGKETQNVSGPIYDEVPNETGDSAYDRQSNNVGLVAPRHPENNWAMQQSKQTHGGLTERLRVSARSPHDNRNLSNPLHINISSESKNGDSTADEQSSAFHF